MSRGLGDVYKRQGEATMEDVENGSIKPDIILPHAKEILQYLG